MSKPTQSKAGPLSKDIGMIVVANIIAVASIVLFAAMGLSIVIAANGSL
ncbi:hypothetical protein ACFO4E_05280 [Nocardiopsis mangrovi]|uniref:Uncharacterized protein n=1 Tax=Nocardiopsis mangrovi TaxID=1179818 RepID=A0ABV9DSB0_9ACTN